MKKVIAFLCVLFLSAGMSFALLTFYMVDNFEDGTASKWYIFDKIKTQVVNNPAFNSKDSIASSCGDYSLKITGSTETWYVGGAGTILEVDASGYTRFSVDVYGSKNRGKIKVEIFEKDPKTPTIEAKWVVELPMLGSGFARYSIPFSSFSSQNETSQFFHGDNGGKISKLQLIFVASAEKGSIDLLVDNLIFSF